MKEIVERLESEVRSYCRSFPAVFTRAEGCTLYDDQGRSYLDFFAGAGTLNYGHNNPHMKEGLIDYIAGSGITHSLDMMTEAKCRLLEAFDRWILSPRSMTYKVMFPGPTGTNSVEAALKLARKVTGRSNVVAFTNAFHGMTLGALAATGNSAKRSGAGVDLHNILRMPFDGYMGPEVDTIGHIETFIADNSSGMDAPAAFIVETVQGEGGVNVASAEWLRRLEALARRHGALLIIDDIQVGCGRTGPFFSFEKFGIQPDIICLSKSLSGYGLPFALTLFKPELDCWSPGEHNGTFRGHNLAFVTAEAALNHYWQDDGFSKSVQRKSALTAQRLERIASRFEATVRGRGMILGLAFSNPETAAKAAGECFKRGMVIETAGAEDEVLKLLPPLTIETVALEKGLDIIEDAVGAASGIKRPIAARWDDDAKAPLVERILQ